MPRNVQRIKVLTAGIFSLALTMGIARFSYTPMLPIMQAQAGLGIGEAGWLASINYLGYLFGALLAASISDLRVKDSLYRWGLLLAVFSTAAMALTTNIWLWSLLRFISGLSTAAGMLIGSGLVLNWLMRHRLPGELGIHFSGVGLGIAGTALLIELIGSRLNWSELWLTYSLLGLLLLIPAWVWLPKPEQIQANNIDDKLADNPPSPRFSRLLMAAYFCAGVGYVVSATFIVAIVEQLPGMQQQGNFVFILLGLAAAPACILWDVISRRTGHLNALILAAFIQTISILLPTINTSFITMILSAMLFGASFMGLVSLVLTMAGRFYPSRPAKMMGKMTVTYGIAQILAPLLVGANAVQNASYNNGLYLAAGFMLIGTLLLVQLKRVESLPCMPKLPAKT